MRKTLGLFILVILLFAVGSADYIMRARGAGAGIRFAEDTLPVSEADNELTVKGQLVLDDGRAYEYTLTMPENWAGKYEIREAGGINWFDYSVSPDLKSELFSLAAVPESEWKTIQQEPGYHGEELLSMDGVVFKFSFALDNPYTDSQAEEFQQMTGQVREILQSLTITLIP
jgi:hypothetical protein